jgi:hypothetical protein
MIANLGWKWALLIVAVSVLSCIFFGILFRPLEKIGVKHQSVENGVATELQPLNDTQVSI